MKTTIEVNGFEIKIEELEGKITVVAEKDGEVMEEFELESGEEVAGEEVAGEEGEEMMPFGDEEEEDFEADEEEEEMDEEEEEMDEEEEEMDEEGKLESFNSFIKKRKK